MAYVIFPFQKMRDGERAPDEYSKAYLAFSAPRTLQRIRRPGGNFYCGALQMVAWNRHRMRGARCIDPTELSSSIKKRQTPSAQIPRVRLKLEAVFQANAMTQQLTHVDSMQSLRPSEGALLLSRKELEDITGTRQAARQRQWFVEHRWPFVEALGRHQYPLVAREVARLHLRCKGTAPAADSRCERNLAALETRFGGRRS